VLSYNRTSILHIYGDMEPHIFWGHNLDLLGSRELGHVTIGHATYGFLFLFPIYI